MNRIIQTCQTNKIFIKNGLKENNVGNTTLVTERVLKGKCLQKGNTRKFLAQFLEKEKHAEKNNG